MNAPESNLVTQFFSNAKRIYQDALRGRDALSIRGVNSESAQAACGRIAEKLCDVERVDAAVAELIERERKAREALRYVMACVGDSGMVERAAREAALSVLAEGGAS